MAKRKKKKPSKPVRPRPISSWQARKAKRPIVKKVGAARVYKGAFGTKKRGPGSYVMRRGVEINKYSQRYLVYDRSRILASPISIPAAHVEMLIDFANWSRAARDFFAAEGHDQDPIIHTGALCINRGRIFQPWGDREYRSADFAKAAGDLISRLRTYEKFAQVANTRATRKTGVIGWFLRARTRPFDPPGKRIKKNADPRTNKKKARPGKSRRGVGRRG